MERAVLLSDIEFLPEVHESHWERIEEDSFLVNVSKPLNENQQIVLEELCSKFDSEIPFQSIYELVKYPEGEVGNRYADLSPLEDLEVLIAFAEWGMKNEQ